MEKLKKIILFITVVFLFNCKDKAQENHIRKEINQKEVNFDTVLKCSDYSYDENYFVTTDYGCIYKQNGNNYGNIIIYLLPKKKSKITDEQIENENRRINGLSIDEYKKEFKIVAFLIDKKYLNQNKSGDPEYYQKSAYEEKAYAYDDKHSKWVFIDSKKINNEEENQNEQTWRKNIISNYLQNEQKNESSNTENIAKIIQMNESKNFSLIKKQNCDLNKDNLEDFILVFKNKEEFDSSDDKTKIAPVIVLINAGKGLYTKYENDFMYPNNFNDLYENLVVKDSYFTIELLNEDPNNYISEKFITFKYDAGNITLHKYSEVINWSNGKIDNTNYTTKNFGLIKFVDFNSNTIVEKVNDKR